MLVLCFFLLGAGIHWVVLFWDPLCFSSPSSFLFYSSLVSLHCPPNWYLRLWNHSSCIVFYANFFMIWKLVFHLSLFVMGSCCCHFLIDDYAWGGPQTCWVLHVKLIVLVGKCHWEAFSFLSVASPAHALKAVIINGETDSRQCTGYSSHVPNTVPFMNWLGKGHYLSVFWHIWFLSIILYLYKTTS